MRRIKLTTLDQRTKHDRRARERKDEAVEHAHARTLTHKQRDPCDCPNRQHDLKEAAERDLPKDHAQASQRELEPD